MPTREEGLSIGRRIELPKFTDKRGNLTFIEQNDHVPFDIKRVFYIYDVPPCESRGGHAHRQVEQFLIALSGSFDLILDDSNQTERIHQNRCNYGIYTPPGVWGKMENISSNMVCLVLASGLYDEDEYINDYQEFTQWQEERSMESVR